MAFLVMVVDQDTEAGAEQAEREHESECPEQPGGVDEVDHFGGPCFGGSCAALRVEAWLLAARFGWFGHGAAAVSPASHVYD